MWKIILAVITVLVLASVLVINIANAAAPGDVLYGLDRSIESLRLSITANSQSISQLENQYIQERQDEIQVLAERGDQAMVEEAVQDLNQEMETSLHQSGSPGDVDKNEKTDQPQDESNDQDTQKNEDEGKPEEAQDGTFCDGTAKKNHPSGEKLAKEYGVSYSEIMGWFCKGYGFGEVDLAYRINKQVGVSVSEIFALRAGGMGWGEILQKYNLIGKPDKEKGKPED